MSWLKVGQTFTIDNPDYHVVDEKWTIISIDYPTINFLSEKHCSVEIAGILPFTTKTVIGTVECETDIIAIISLKFNLLTCEKGIFLEGERASYLKSVDPIIYL
jgi:hypothetical protein